MVHSQTIETYGPQPNNRNIWPHNSRAAAAPSRLADSFVFLAALIPLLTPRHHHITPVLKPLHWLKIPERIHFKVLSLTYNSLQSSQPTYLRELFTIQPTRSSQSSSCLTFSRPPVTSHLTFSERAISVTAPLLWNDLPPELRTFSLPPPSSLQSIKHHLNHAPLSVTPQAFHSKLKFHLFKLSFSDSPDSISPHSSPKLHPP